MQDEVCLNISVQKTELDVKIYFFADAAREKFMFESWCFHDGEDLGCGQQTIVTPYNLIVITEVLGLLPLSSEINSEITFQRISCTFQYIPQQCSCGMTVIWGYFFLLSFLESRFRNILTLRFNLWNYVSSDHSTHIYVYMRSVKI